MGSGLLCCREGELVFELNFVLRALYCGEILMVWYGFIKSMQFRVELGYQLRICSRTIKSEDGLNNVKDLVLTSQETQRVSYEVHSVNGLPGRVALSVLKQTG
jgi:hypothetical protein